MRGIISFNVIGEELYTRNPGLLYYHGKGDEESVKSVFSEDNALTSWLINNAISLSNYSSLSIYYTTYFTEDDAADTEEVSKQGHVLVSDIISFDDIKGLLTKLALKKAFNTDINDDVAVTVKKLLSMRLSMQTVINGVRKACQDANINKEGISEVMKELQKNE